MAQQVKQEVIYVVRGEWMQSGGPLTDSEIEWLSDQGAVCSESSVLSSLDFPKPMIVRINGAPRLRVRGSPRVMVIGITGTFMVLEGLQKTVYQTAGSWRESLADYPKELQE